MWVNVREYVCVWCVIKTFFLEPENYIFDFSGPTGRGESWLCNYLLVEVFRQPW